MFVFIKLQGCPVHCNLLWPGREAALSAPKGNIRLGFCRACGMIYNLAFNPGLLTYTQAYENSLHFSPYFQAYAQELATRLVEQYHLYGKDIVEIGCGTGEFLSLLCEGGRNRAFGFDPSYDGRTEGGVAGEHVTFIRDFYSESYAGYPADFICCRQVLEHIHSPRDFLSQLRRAIGDQRDSVVFFEVPDALYTLRDLGIWDIIYEHCSYFSAPSLTQLFQNSGFTVSQVYPTFGAQFLCLEATPGIAESRSHMASAKALTELARFVSAFGAHYRNKVDAWGRYLDGLFEKGCRIVVWGAGSKGVTFLNTVRGGSQIEYVVDISPRKQGMYVPGTGQRIVPPDFLHEYRPEALLVMNPNYKDEIRGLIDRLGVAAEIVTV